MARSVSAGIVLLSGFLLALVAACGGDDGGEPGTDASYTAELCTAMSQTNRELEKLAKEADSLDFPKLASRVSGILHGLADSLDEAAPPADLESWNKDAAKTIRKAGDSLTKTQQSSTLDVLGDSPLPDPPTAIRARIEAAARDIPACRGLSLFGE